MLNLAVDNSVEEVKQKTDIVRVISGIIPLKKRGRHYQACCPFHSEKTPSFIVSPELQIFKCFGCGKGGDVFTFLQEYEKIDFREALEQLAKQAGVTLTHSAQMTHQDHQRRRLLEINSEVARFYHYLLASHPLGKKALDYVLDRGITLATINQFKIGFSPPRTPALANRLIKKGFTSDELVATGTFGQSGSRLYDRFQDRLVFPLADYHDRILGFSGRILPTSSNTNLAKYINSPETPLYHKSFMVYGLNFAKESIRQQNSVIVVEGEFDMISPFQAGFTNIVALKGTAFTEPQLQLLHRYTDTLILALDSDFAGNTAARRSIELADSAGFDIKVLTLGQYKDPDDCVRSDPKFFATRLDNLLPVWDFLINTAVATNGIDTIKGKKQILEQTLPSITKIGNSVIRADYLRKLAQELDAPLDAILSEAQKHPSTPSSSPPVTLTTTTDLFLHSTQAEKQEEFLLTLIIGAKNPPRLIKKLEKYRSLITLPRFQLIWEKLASQSDFDPRQFVEKLPTELQSVFQNLYLLSTTFALDSVHRSREVKKIINLLQTNNLKSQISALSSRIAHLENAKDDPQLASVEQQYTTLLSQLSKLQK